MNRRSKIQRSYQALGGEHTFYDGMITCATLGGKAVCKLVWNMNREKNNHYIQLALSGIPGDFSGKMLEIPVGTGILTMPIYATLPKAEITCVDYSVEMMARAQRRAGAMGISNVSFYQGDVGALQFPQETYDLVLSLNGFHAFPDKKAAYEEVFRVLKPGGIFCGCFYVRGENRRTDWFIRKVYVPKGFFTPPFETAESLKDRLQTMFTEVQVNCVEGMACFTCKK
ncbi:putative methyltransferase YcgJ [Anaerotignum neopropionicum]|uniref:Putative methyltransferase YcgJ n=1 Tax=Anaerotignum neopropionicum TaxID=36847 RepID=A0A136WJ31_9FIRM|nr:class I SAM-dependent methyltransferase [Anaerotignum neopropionicum]KXL54234.1 putative methyltransferase YcgJ [Anaerotignum neopropionicum]KXL54359.1 putative methyltransferase YcgJ [Anaerotignum neopropionicum]